MDGNFDGWIPVNEIWEYFSDDSPTFTFKITGDKTNKYSPGMRIKLTQSSIQYFIITDVSYNDPNTTITVYGGTDYALEDADIILPFYSTAKAPLGFSLDPTKWTVQITDNSNRTQTNPTVNTWYNLGSINIDIPIGVWYVDFQVCASCNRSALGELDQYAALSISNNSGSDPDLITRIQEAYSTGISGTLTRSKVLTLTDKTTYYLNSTTISANSTQIIWLGAFVHPTVIRAICAYL